jgi:hypothetical protein
MQKTMLLCLLLFALQSVAQTTSPSTMNMGGGSKKISPDFIVDWSIGESSDIKTYYLENPAYNTYIGRYWNITSGILQPFDNVHIIVNPSIPAWTVYEVHFYPVPAADYVTIDFKSSLSGKISIQLLGNSGKFLEEKEFNMPGSSSTVTWDLSQRASAIYFFKIILSSPQGKILKEGAFKIQKVK